MRNAQIFKFIERPLSADTLGKHLAERPDRLTQDREEEYIGFLPVEEGRFTENVGGNLVAFTCRIHKRKVPASVLKRKYEEALKDRTLSRREKAELRDFVRAELLKKAFDESRDVACYIDHANQIMVMDTPSAKTAEDIFFLLIELVGDLSSRPLVGDLGVDLGRAMSVWLQDESHCPFLFEDEATVIGSDGEKVAFKNIHAKLEEVQAIGPVDTVESMRLSMPFEADFTLTMAAELKRIVPADDITAGIEADDEEAFRQAYLIFMSDIIAKIVQRLYPR